MVLLESLPAAPPEWWERKRDEFRERAFDTAWFNKMLKIRAVVTWGGLIVAILVTLLITEFRGPLKASIYGMVTLAVMFMIVRTKTVRWSSVGALFSITAMWAFVVIGLSYLGARVGGIGVASEGASIGIAAFFEEALKLVPLFVAAVLAPGRMRKMGACDWLLMGFACGWGFNIAEEGTRDFLFAVNPLTPFQEALGITQPNRDYGPNPFTAGNFLDPGSGAFTPGHAIGTAIAAACIGLAIYLWRTGHNKSSQLIWRSSALLVAFVGIMIPTSIHAAFNAAIKVSDFAELDGSGFSTLMAWFWEASGKGNRSVGWLVALLLICTIADGVRRTKFRASSAAWASPGRFDEVGAGRRAAASVESAEQSSATWVRSLIGGFAVAVRYLAPIIAGLANDVAALGAYRRQPGEDRASAIQRGRDAVEEARSLSERSLEAALPGAEVQGRNKYRRTCRPVTVLSTAIWVVLGVLVAKAVGESLANVSDGSGPFASDPAYFANLFHLLGDWWGEQSLLTQMALMIGIAALVALTFGSFWWTFWGSSDFRWVEGRE